MSIVNLAGLSVTEASFKRARRIVDEKPAGSVRTANDVLASLRKMMPGWTITTSSEEWTEGFRNIEIDPDILRQMAEDPDVMTAYKALILDIAETAPEIEAWGKQNAGQLLEFGVTLEADGSVTAMMIVRTLMGGEVSTTFNLPEDRGSWSDIIRERLDALAQGQVEDAYGTRSWIA